MTLAVFHPAIVWASEEGKAHHAAWVVEERARVRDYRLGRARYDYEFTHCAHDGRGRCPTCAKIFLDSGRELAALAIINVQLATEEAEALAASPKVMIGEHWSVQHPETGEELEGLVMGSWRDRSGDLAFHPLGPARKSDPERAFPVSLTHLLATGKRWT